MRVAAPETQDFYKDGAAALIAASIRQSGREQHELNADEILRAVQKHMEGQEQYLALGTVCVYRQFLRVAVDILIKEGAEANEAEKVRSDLLIHLEALSKLKRVRRGAAWKIDPTLDELRDVFYFLKQRFFEESDPLDLLLALFVLLMPRIGLRPIELTWAARDGLNLVVSTAKVRGRPVRSVPLDSWPDDYLEALDLLLRLVPRNLSPEEYKRWRNRLASRLARASQHTRRKRRLSLYCTRHLSIADWRAIGMTPEEIRLLAGHIKLGSQQSYGRGGTGFEPGFSFLQPGSIVTETAASLAEAVPTGGAPPATAENQRSADLGETTSLVELLPEENFVTAAAEAVPVESAASSAYPHKIGQLDDQFFPAPAAADATAPPAPPPQRTKQAQADLDEADRIARRLAENGARLSSGSGDLDPPEI